MRTPRTLHLLDVEYLGARPTFSAADLDLVMDRYRPMVGCSNHDHLVGAASNWVYKRIAWDIDPAIRLIPAGWGPDAADIRLIDEAHTIDLTRYDRVVIASGDHRFTDLAVEVHDLGLEIWAAGYWFNTSRRLAGAVDRAIDLSDYGLAS